MQMLALRAQQQQQQGGMPGAQPPFLQWNNPERGEAILQDFMDQQGNSQSIVPVMNRYTSCLKIKLCKILDFYGSRFFRMVNIPRTHDHG